eukprot:Skav230113  [mRNA]  locus=scaffold283:259459:262528:- [translate_table: standard]
MRVAPSKHRIVSALLCFPAVRGLKPKEKFDVGEPSPTLTEVLALKTLGDCKGKRALVPGCGRAYDAVALAEYGFDSVVAVDLSATAVEAAKTFLSESKSPAASKIEASADVIWDCTFLCALDPSVRAAWAKQTRSLLKADGTLLTCIFPICDKEMCQDAMPRCDARCQLT